MKKYDVILTCKKIKFYSQKDEDVFFEWVKKIECIDKTTATGNELYLHIASNNLEDDDLRDLLGLFCRYKIDMKQLHVFLNKKNKKWFCNKNKKGFWYKKVFKL
jgi:hypothetical protein